jgi:hypothetical protein
MMNCLIDIYVSTQDLNDKVDHLTRMLHKESSPSKTELSDFILVSHKCSQLSGWINGGVHFRSLAIEITRKYLFSF